jgi:hypothetical protein
MRALDWQHDETAWRRVVSALSLFSAVSAIGGAAELLFDHGGRFAPPVQLLQHTPFTSFVIPALLLLTVVGGSGLWSAVLTWRDSDRAIDAQLLAGGSLTVWIAAETAMLRALHPLQLIYGALGLVLLGFGVIDAWRSHRPHLRWLICVTPAEALGFMVPMLTGLLTRDPSLVIAAGLIEGFALGVGQALGFPFRVPPLAYATASAFGAGVAWLCIMLAMRWQLYELMPIGLLSIGTIQSFVLRRRHLRWIGWTALAWIAALPCSFLPMPFVDEATPLVASVALWACAGLLMAYVMALITWVGVLHTADEWRRGPVAARR